jgi:hypothetical protein
MNVIENLLVIDWQQMVSHLVLLSVAFILALPIGLDRERSRRAFGLRTYPTVAVVACGFFPIRSRTGSVRDPTPRTRTTEVVFGRGTMLELLILFLVVLAVLTVVLRRQRHRAWRAFARRYDLVFHRESNGRPVVTGDIDGRPCRLAISTESSDTGIVGAEVIELSLTGRFGAPDGLDIQPGTSNDPLILDDEPIATGDDAFDGVVRILGDDPAQIRSFLTPVRREALRPLFEETDWDSAELRGAELRIRQRRAISRVEVIEAGLHALLETSRRLEALEQPPPIT